MSGILFPDFARSFGAGQALRQQEQQNAFQMERMRRDDEVYAREQEAAQHVPGALSGDRDALGKVATLSPKTAMSIAPLLERMDSNQRAKLKEQFEATGKAAAGILALPETEQPAAYEATYRALTQQGYKINLPPKWSPALKGQLQSYAVQVPEYLKMLGDQPQPLGGVPGGTPTAGGGAPGDVLVRTKQAIAGNESGGRYDAVGPDTGSGKRAYGKYQVMDFNVGPWTQEALGRPMTPQEFLASPQAQEAVADFKLGQYIKQFGSPEAAARAWFAGPGGMNNTAAKDVLGTTVGGYSQKFSQQYGDGATGTPPGMAVGDTQPRADASGTPLPPQGQSDNEWPTVRDFVKSKYPGAKVLGFRDGSIAYDKQGRVRIRTADGQDDAVEIPKGKDLQKQGAGPFGGTSVEAQALNMLIANGTLSQQQAAELAAGKTITNPADGSVMFMTPSGLFGQRPGQPPQPVGAPGAAPPAGAAPQPGSGMIPVTPPKPVQMTEGQSNAALYADRMREADATITSNEKAGMSIGGKALEAVPGGAGNYLQSDEYQLFEQARRNFINAVLRRESGAVIADSEFANAEKQYFPRPGDSEAVIKQKAANRRSAIEGISRAAGPAYKPQGATPQQAAPEAGGEKRLTPEEAQKLPPGTTFIGTDGVQRVRR